MKDSIAIDCQSVDKKFNSSSNVSWWRELIGFNKSENISNIYALKDITLEVSKGNIVGILGHNGAGKSTLLRVLAGIYSPTAGHISVYGAIAGLFELGGMGNPALTGSQYALRYLHFMGVGTKTADQILSEIQDFSELSEAFNQPIRTYSSGMAARLYFATATALQHEIYLIDELLTVGDMHFQNKCWNRIRKLLLNGASGVLVTHDWTAAARLCKTTGILLRGRMKFLGTSDKAVVEYLELPMPNKEEGRFSSDLASNYVVNAGDDVILKFPIELEKKMKLAFGASIEILRVGIGWETIILHEVEAFELNRGKHEINFSIPSIPIMAGEYSLNIFLSEICLNGSSIQMDARTWTLGNGLHLSVIGNNSVSDIKLPFTESDEMVDELCQYL